jgi:hypothetical protein
MQKVRSNRAQWPSSAAPHAGSSSGPNATQTPSSSGQVSGSQLKMVQ